MSNSEKYTATVSAEGQMVLPEAVRQALGWKAGTELTVETASDYVVLKPAPIFAETRIEDVFGCLPYKGPPKTIEEMDAGVLEEARRRHAGD